LAYKALITTRDKSFHLDWFDGRVVSDAADDRLSDECVAYLNDKPWMSFAQLNKGGTDSHWREKSKLTTDVDFLLTVGSLIDNIEGVVDVELVEK
jgi:hypothetical protein